MESGPPDRQAPLGDADFERELREVIPHLRAFARSLAGSADRADDLVQDAMFNAWRARDRFRPGTNFKAWMFVIVRNLFLSGVRRARFSGDWDEGVAERTLATAPSQEQHLSLDDVRRALLQLTPSRRDALILVGAGGFSYEETAELCGCPVGTIKSRVARARSEMEQLLAGGMPRRLRQTKIQPVEDLMEEIDRLSG